MSAPKTNIETQTRRHRGPLIGMIVVVIFAVGLIVYWLVEEAAQSDPGQGNATQIDGRTGAPVDGPAASPTDPTTGATTPPPSGVTSP